MQLLMGVANPNRPLFELILLGLAIGFMLSGIITAVGQVLGKRRRRRGRKTPKAAKAPKISPQPPEPTYRRTSVFG